MFGEKDRAICSKGKRCGRWLGCLERKTEQEMWHSKGKRCGRWLGCLERKTEQDIVRARDVADG